ncbi:MAG: transcription antitermination protein NusB [Muribaculaceae bacterium]|nr:transcription antitermination protein NusB [Muribaculaceae bacterium]
MINRILIRIKVVQMLYSYLLTRKEFKLEVAPETASRDKKYAYTLYLDLFILLLKLSGYSLEKGIPQKKDSSNLLSSLKITKSLISYDEIRRYISQIDNKWDSSLISRLYSLIINSVVYKDFKKNKSPEIQDEVLFWTNIVNTIILREPLFIESLRNDSQFTNVGFEQGISMFLNTLSDYCDSRTLLLNAQKALTASLNKGYELYHRLLNIMVEITRMQEIRIDAAKSKYLPTHDDLNPNMKFVENKFIAAIQSNPNMQAYLSTNPITWEEDTLLIKSLLDKIINSDVYQEYMSSSESNYVEDCNLWKTIFKNIILPSEELSETLESKSVYWNDDLDIMGTFVLKTIKQFANNGENTLLLPQYKDEEDKQFGDILFTNAIKNSDIYRQYIDKFVNGGQWDPERLAFMDIVIMIAAITELIYCPSIPIPVTLNEYIEIANCYSTPKSGQFINGILYSVITQLKNEGKLNKA